MIGACKPTVPLLDDAVDVLQKDNYKAWCCSVVINLTSTTPSSASTLTTRSLHFTVVEPAYFFKGDAAVSVEPTLLNRPVTGRCASVVLHDTSSTINHQWSSPCSTASQDHCDNPTNSSAFQVPAVSQSMQRQNSVSLPWVNLTPQLAKTEQDLLCCRFGWTLPKCARQRFWEKGMLILGSWRHSCFSLPVCAWKLGWKWWILAWCSWVL